MTETEKEFDNYKNEMINGDARAAYNVAYCYVNGEGVEQDYDLGFKYIKVSAGLGNVTAIYNMFCLYSGVTISGLTVDKNYNEKMRYAKLLANASSIFNIESEEEKYTYIGKLELAVNYANSKKPQDEQKKGFIILKELADMGFPDAQYYTAICYINAIGTFKNYDSARYYASACMYNNRNDVYGIQNKFKDAAMQLCY